MEELYAQLDEGEEEQQVKWGRGVYANLRGYLVEAEDPGEQDDENSRDADRGVDAENDAEGEAPGETARSDAATELAEQRAQDLAAAELADGLEEKHFGLDA